MASPLSGRVDDEPSATSGASILGAFATLLVLTASSWALAHVHLGAFNPVVALAIAFVKASVVAYVFMELSHGTTAIRTIALITISFILLMCLGFGADTALR